ncbi:hypothetical protein B0T17DRAFT_494555 [Bombardia bombarda]|uniref:non-specific serine/threonine protein kinase n=1 Tax=Bombardia bombarda TaxID=252184 RepID=A0AA40C0W0_9PEZI|nr:hypothetical protein B0T17DRAFT_494555 [Bombardia bombarda]
MSRTAGTSSVRKYGKPIRKTRAEMLFAELPGSPPQATVVIVISDDEDEEEEDAISKVAEQLGSTALRDDSEPPLAAKEREGDDADYGKSLTPALDSAITRLSLDESGSGTSCNDSVVIIDSDQDDDAEAEDDDDDDDEEEEEASLRILAWDDVCPPGDRIEKIAEASYAEVYRITNERGTSIIKVVRLESPIKAQTKAQARSGLVDEEPHSEADLQGELLISEWLADIPGFVVYKERYVVRGRAPKALLETHQVFHRRMKRKDPDRLQYYPSPSRYLDETRFLVVELGDAGTALEDFSCTSAGQLWDIFLHTAIALARAEELIRFEHRDLHEGNLCIRQARPAKPKPIDDDDSPCQFGYSGLEITILDYGLSRAQQQQEEDSSTSSPPPPPPPIAYDLEKDLSIFTSTHAPQCRVYRHMRSFLLRHDRVHLAPEHHHTPYDLDVLDRPLSWTPHYPYTNVLWLAYIYRYIIEHFTGDKAELLAFRKMTREMARHLDPEAPRRWLSFGSAVDVVRFVVEAGWVTEAQLMEDDDERGRGRGGNESIIAG